MTLPSDYRALTRSIPLFRGLGADDVARILAHGRTVRAAKGEVVFYEGTTGSSMFVVLGGTVSIYEGKKLLATLGQGETFGEMALIDNDPRSASAVAAEDCKLFELTETTFQRLLTKRVSVQILLNIVGTLSHRLRETSRRMVRLQAELAQAQAPPGA